MIATDYINKTKESFLYRAANVLEASESIWNTILVLMLPFDPIHIKSGSFSSDPQMKFSLTNEVLSVQVKPTIYKN